MTDPKPLPAELAEEARILETALEVAAKAHELACQDLAAKQQALIAKLCEIEGLDQSKQQVVVFTDRGEYSVVKEFENYELVAKSLTEDMDRQEMSNTVAMCYAFSLFQESGIEMPDAARELLLEQAKSAPPAVLENLKGYLYS